MPVVESSCSARHKGCKSARRQAIQLQLTSWRQTLGPHLVLSYGRSPVMGVSPVSPCGNPAKLGLRPESCLLPCGYGRIPELQRT